MNKTSEIYSSLLDDLQKNKYNKNSIIHRKYTCANNMGIIYSVSVDTQMRSLEIPVDKISKSLDFPIWKGVKIGLVTMPDYAPDNQLYIHLQQMQGTEAYIFEIVVEDLRRCLERMPTFKESTECTMDTLKKWKNFFSSGKTPILTNESAQGLYGELLFLYELIFNMGTTSVNCWAGASNETHDFYIGQNAVEIKTTSTQAPYMAHINSEYQLDNLDVYGKLFLRMYALRKNSNGGQRLPEIVEKIRVMLQKDFYSKSFFDIKLSEAGYLDAAAEYYQEGYTIREIYSFEVKDGFPRIAKQNVPNGVYKLEYAISIAQCMDYAIESKDLFKGIRG